MKVAGMYSLKNGQAVMETDHGDLLEEIKSIIQQVNADECQTKESKEKTMLGRRLYSPTMLNQVFKDKFKEKHWKSQKLYFEPPTNCYSADYENRPKIRRSSQEIDFVKGKVGVEVQLGKYSFYPYDILAKMPIFAKQKVITCGVEIVLTKGFIGTGKSRKVSTGVAYYEQFLQAFDLRGAADIDIPVLIIGIDI